MRESISNRYIAWAHELIKYEFGLDWWQLIEEGLGEVLQKEIVETSYRIKDGEKIERAKNRFLELLEHPTSKKYRIG